MADYWRAAIPEEFKETMEEFIEDHPELGFENPKELMIHATRNFMMENRETLTKDEVMEYFRKEIFDE